MAKAITGQRDPVRTVKVDDQTIVVHHHLAFRHFVYGLCRLVVGFDARLAGATMDACETGLCGATFCISYEVPSNL